MSTFEIVRGVEGDCLVLDGTRICGPKPLGGGRIIDTFRTDGIYEVIDNDEYRKLMTESAKLRELAAGIGHLLFVLDVDYCVICPRDDINHPCPVHTVKGGECLYKTDLRELGVEVDEYEVGTQV